MLTVLVQIEGTNTDLSAVNCSFCKVPRGAVERFKQTVQTSAKPSRTQPFLPADGGILLSAVELFAGRTGHSTAERQVFRELAENLLPATSLRDRRQIANLLSSHSEAPEAVVSLLARDDDALSAYAILRHSPLLSVDLLKEIVLTGPESSRKAISGRDGLPLAVMLSLADNSGADTIRLLLERKDLPQPVKDRLSRRADLAADLGEELSNRLALSTEGLMSQFLHLPASLKPKAIAAAETVNVIKLAQSPAPARQPALNTARLRLHGALLKAARLKKHARFADSLGQGLGLPGTVSDMLLQEEQAEALVIALKALGMDRNATTTVLVSLLGDRLALPEIRKLLFLHRNLSTGAAEALIGCWTFAETRTGQAPATTVRHAAQFEDSGRIGRDPRQHQTRPAAPAQNRPRNASRSD